MAELSSDDRDALKDSDFAYVDSQGERHLPIHDDSHVKNAVARFSQTHFDKPADKTKAAKAIVAAARKHGVDVADDDEVAKAAG